MPKVVPIVLAKNILPYYLVELSGASGAVECHLCRLAERPALNEIAWFAIER